MPHELVTIAFSHFCEKARWALDRYGVAYEERRMLPFFHMGAVWARTRGKTRAADRVSSKLSTPLLITDDGTSLHDSSDILRWVDARHAGGALYAPEEAAAIEEELDASFGAHARRLAYHHILARPALLSELATNNVSRRQAAVFNTLRPAAVAGLRRGLGVNGARAARSEEKVRAAMDRMDARLADGRLYLCGDAFSAADLTWASLAAPVVAPAEYGAWLPAPEQLGPEGEALIREARERPSGAFALRMFAEERSARA